MADAPTPLDLPGIRAELLRIIGEVLGEALPPLPDDTPLLDFVQSSLALVEGMRRIYEHFGVLISIRRVMEGQATLGGIAAYLEQELLTQRSQPKEAPTARTAEPQPAAARLVPLAPSQRHVGFLARYSSEAAAAFNESLALELAGTLDGPALQAALDAVVERYEALRTSLNPDRDELSVQSGPSVELAVAQCQPASLSQRLAELVARPFSPGERLFRAELLRLAERRHVLVLVSHALVLEPEALPIILEDLAAYYSAYAENREPAPGFPALQWTDYLALGQADMAVQARQAAEAYWRPVLARDWPRLELPGDQPRPPIKRYSGARLVVHVDPILSARLDGWAQAHRVSVADVWLGAYTLYLSRLSGQMELVVGVRSAPLYLDAGQRVAAQTRNMLPLRSRLDGQASFAQHVRTLAASLSQAEQHRHLSLAEMIQLQDPPRDQSRSALFTAAFQHQRRAAPPELGALRTTRVPLPAPGARYDLELVVSETPDGTQLVCDYSTELFEPETIRRWMDGWSALLVAGLDDPESACGLLPMLPEREHRQQLWDWNDTARAYPNDKTLLDLFIAQAQAHPAAPAIQCGETIWTYTQLRQRVEALAAHLAGHGVSTGDRVGILIERSPDLVAGLLAAWRMGALYVPLDPAFPPKRLAYLLADAGARIVLTSLALRPLLGENLASPALCLEECQAEVPELGEAVQSATANSSAYLIYTSGSTGQPKGVEVGHRGLVNCLLAVQASLGFQAGDALLAVTTPSFDISAVELFMPLIAGGMVNIAPQAVVGDGFALAELIATHKPSLMQATPSTWKMILAAGWQGDDQLGIASGGESLSRELAEQLIVKGRGLWNLYGPTETTVWATAGQLTSAPGRPVSIGRPLANMQAYILDDRRQPVPLGAVGELYLGGEGVARGYWGQPQLTIERFVPHPFHPGECLYRTGDLARYLPDGSLVCLGRIDHQVKIHGVRVELGEIEAALGGLAGVRDAVVTAWRDPRGDLQLVGHVIADQPAPSAAELRARLREQLPEVMIPPYIQFAEAFPLTANGKIRRADLPTPDSRPHGPLPRLDRPETPTERLLAEAWSRVLGLDLSLIGRDSDFMDLGGHSLLMTPLMQAVRQHFQVSFSLREFFGATTVRSLAALIDQRRRALSADGRSSASRLAGRARTAEWGRQRMAFLQREAQLPPSLVPARGLSYRPASEVKTVFLTGGSGFLGAYLIAEILRTTAAELYCLVRPKRGQNGKDRIEQQMRHYAVWRDDEGWRDNWHARLHVVDGDVTLPRLGLADSAYETLAREVDAILHGAAHVNFIYPYEALRATNVLGLHEIVRFAFHTRIKPVHHLSTAAIWPMGAQFTFYEKDPIEHGQVLNLGYDEAKWVAERCLLYAAERGLPVARYRPGEVGGDSVTGRCVTDHFLIAAIKGFLQFGAFPALDIEVDVAPVDYVAKALVYLLFRRDPLGRAFHLTNPTRQHMSAALTYLRSLGYRFDELPFSQLRDRLVGGREFGANALFAYQATLEDMDDVSLQLPTYDTRQVERELHGSGITCPPADEKLFGLYLRYLQEVGFIPQPERLPVVA